MKITDVKAIHINPRLVSRYVGHEVLDWTLNGVHVKELFGSHPGIYGHTGDDVPHIIARENGFLYCIYYSEHGLNEALDVVSGFRVTTL